MSVAVLHLAVAVHEEDLQRRLEVATILLAMNALVQQHLVHVLVLLVVALLASAHWALLAILAVGQRPGERTGVAEEVPVVALSALVHDQEADVARELLRLFFAQILEHLLWEASNLLE